MSAWFADIGDDYNVDVDSLAAAITPSTKVLLPVHLYGQAADMVAISALAESRGLAVVEDAAQSHGATQAGRPVGSWGIGCFSLYGTKNVTTGEGGLVTTNDDAIADRIRVLRNQGMRARYQYEVPGHNYRLTDLAAAVGIPQLERLGEINRTEGLTMLIVEQNAGLALEIAQRGYVLETGTIVAQGTAEELGADEDVRKAYLGF